MAEGVGFEPTVGLPLLLISSQVPLTTQPPFRFSSGRLSATFNQGAIMREFAGAASRFESCSQHRELFKGETNTKIARTANQRRFVQKCCCAKFHRLLIQINKVGIPACFA